jgi:micrococcal nuclease
MILSAMRKITSSIKGLLLLLCLLALVALSLISPCFAREPIRPVTGTVTKISDGGTIQITTPEQTKLKVRLYGIDAPETPKINQRTKKLKPPRIMVHLI